MDTVTSYRFEQNPDAYHLILKESWSGNEIKFLPSSELEFFNTQRAFPLKFTKDNTGKVVQVLAFNRDLWTRVKE